MLTRPPQPELTGGEEQPEPACTGRWFVYDVLIDTSGGPIWHEAVREARDICSRCQLWRTCLAENRGEEWAEAVITGKSAQQKAMQRRRAA